MKKLNKELLKSNIEKIAKYDFENNKVFGSAYCVIQGEDEFYKKCFGTMSLNSTEPVTENTIFRLASIFDFNNSLFSFFIKSPDKLTTCYYST